MVDVHNTDAAQIAKQLDKLVNVLEITELQPVSSIERELMVAGVEGIDSDAVRNFIDEVGDSVLDSNDRELIVSVHPLPNELDACEAKLRKFGILELQRTGRIALGRLDS